MIMNTFEAICSRKSVRNYTGEGVSSEELDKILKAADAAPIGMGQYESMHLTVITNKELLNAIDGAGAKMFGKPDMHPLYGAPVFILVSTKAPAKMMENVAYSNAAIVAHNIALEATELGIGACYIWGAVAAINSSPDIIGKLNLPEGFIPCCGVTLGKTDYEYKLRDIPSERIARNVIE